MKNQMRRNFLEKVKTHKDTVENLGDVPNQQEKMKAEIKKFENDLREDQTHMLLNEDLMDLSMLEPMMFSALKESGIAHQYSNENLNAFLDRKAIALNRIQSEYKNKWR